MWGIPASQLSVSAQLRTMKYVLSFDVYSKWTQGQIAYLHMEANYYYQVLHSNLEWKNFLYFKLLVC